MVITLQAQIAEKRLTLLSHSAFYQTCISNRTKRKHTWVIFRKKQTLWTETLSSTPLEKKNIQAFIYKNDGDGGEEQNKERQQPKTSERERGKEEEEEEGRYLTRTEGPQKRWWRACFFFSPGCLLFLIIVVFSLLHSFSPPSSRDITRPSNHHRYMRSRQNFAIKETTTSNLDWATTRGDMSKINISTSDIAKTKYNFISIFQSNIRPFQGKMYWKNGNSYPIQEI